jgi:uncharacterized iron-regulated membrane protein
MSWGEWARRPQKVWLRRALFQIHMWTGLGVGIYVFLISISGSAIVYRPELLRAFARSAPVVTGSGMPMTESALKDAARRAYPEYEISQIWGSKKPDAPVEIWLEHEGTIRQRLFDPYTGEDLGEAVMLGERVVMGLISFHDTLLYGDVGRTVNGVGALCLALLCLTGAVIWWPGSKTWRRSLIVPRKLNWQRFNWHLHSMLGFWSLALVIMWAITGASLAFPHFSAAVVEYFEPAEQATVFPRRGDWILTWFGRLHFGRFGGRFMKASWVVLGLVPPALFVTGALIWWKRVVRPRFRRVVGGVAA